MAISCTLGLTACLLFQGNRIPAKDAFVILDNCNLIAQTHARNFNGSSGWGVAAAEQIESLGVKLDWPKGGVARRASFLRTCAAFRAAFNQDSMWKNLDKWPK